MSAEGYKYNYPEKVRPAPISFLVVFMAALAFAAAMYFIGGTFFVLYLIPFIIILANSGVFGPTRRLEIHPRFLICGSKVVYFEMVQEVRYDEHGGTLALSYHDGRAQNRLVIERERFPTNARKAVKIANNKAEKFRKVAGKIRDYIRQQAPQAVER